MAKQFASLKAALADHYHVERELGHGGMATVYLAQDLKLHRPVALKVLRPELAAALGPERFLREVRITARLNHPHILALLDSGEARGLLYYTMPYVDGESLRDRLNREKQLPLDDALQIAREVADALSYAHSHDVVHRDIKPENILLESKHAVVADFGIARAITAAGGDRLTETGIAMGTPAYMSPEQAAGSTDLDGRSDLYSLGCVLYEMLAGRPPFVGPTLESVVHQQLTAEPPSVTSIRSAVPGWVSAALSRALAKTPADRFNPVALFVEAIMPRPSAGVSRQAALPGISKRARLALVGGAILAIAALAVLLLRPTRKLTLDPNLVVVAPFDVLDTKLELWKEGLVDVLSRNLDGAGPLRTVSPTVVMRRWSGRADPASATELGNRTGAGLAVFGQLVGTHGDSVRLTATLYDVARRSAVDDIEARDLEANMDRLVDSLTVALLRELSRSRPIGAVRLGSLGSSSLPAIKAFLRAEQFYRRALWDSVLDYAQRAVAIDSNFTLALRRISLALGWRSDTYTSSTAHLLREGARSRGLAPRESLLVTADSLFGALNMVAGTSLGASPPLARRLYSTLEEAVRRYPDDPEVWYQRGEAGVHWASSVGVPLTAEQTLESFERAIQLDSAFAPAYEHVTGLALELRGPDLARRYAIAVLRAGPRATTASGLRLVELLLRPSGAKATDARRMLDTISGDALWRAWTVLAGWPDSAETAVQLARLLAVPRQGYRAQDSSQLGWILPFMLSYRGHLHEGIDALSGSRSVVRNAFLFLEAALLGAVPHDSAAAVFERWLRSTNRWAAFGAGWWAATGDSTSIRELTRRAGSLVRTAHNPADRSYWRYVELSSRPYLALAHHDTSAAIDGLVSLPDSVCYLDCFFERLQLGLLLESRRRDRQAAALLDREPYPPWAKEPIGTLWALGRARVNERLGNKVKAITAYRFVSEVWINADPELQPYVAEAKAALRRLGGEPR